MAFFQNADPYGSPYQGLLSNPVYGQGILGGGMAQPQAAPPPVQPALGGNGGGFFRDNSNTLMNFGSALLSQPTFGLALADFGQRAPQAIGSDRKRRSMNEVLKNYPNLDPASRAYFMANPEAFDSYMATKLTKTRDIRNDPNGIPRYTDTSEEVFPGIKPLDEGPPGIFSGKSVMGQGLNYLINKGKITEEQAAMLAASKPVTGADGTIYLATPQGVFANNQPVVGDGSEGEMGGDGADPYAMAAPGQPPGANGMIPLTGPKTYGNEEQTKNAGFAKRMIAADQIISTPASADASTSLVQQGLSRVPVAGNFMVSDNYQKVDQAQRDFVNAILRRESGAAISPSEFENARQQYFPQPGDSDAVIQQKAANRQTAIAGLRQSAGPLSQGFIGGNDGGYTVKRVK